MKDSDKLFNKVCSIVNLLLDETIDLEEILNNMTNTLSSLLVLYFTNFKYKLNRTTKENPFIELINETLQNSNSKLIIIENISKNDFIHSVIYFLLEYDIINEYINYLSKINKNSININIKNIVNTYSHDDKEGELNNTGKMNFLQSFNNFNYTCKNLKKQTDSFINLSYKLHELLKTQNNPIK